MAHTDMRREKELWDDKRTTEFGSIFTVRRQKGGLRQTIDLRCIWIMRPPEAAAPDDRAPANMDHGTPKEGCAKR